MIISSGRMSANSMTAAPRESVRRRRDTRVLSPDLVPGTQRSAERGGDVVERPLHPVSAEDDRPDQRDCDQRSQQTVLDHGHPLLLLPQRLDVALELGQHGNPPGESRLIARAALRVPAYGSQQS